MEIVESVLREPHFQPRRTARGALDQNFHASPVFQQLRRRRRGALDQVAECPWRPSLVLAERFVNDDVSHEIPPASEGERSYLPRISSSVAIVTLSAATLRSAGHSRADYPDPAETRDPPSRRR